MTRTIKQTGTYFLRFIHGQKAADGTPLHDKYAVINAYSIREARDIALKFWGNKWGDICDSIREIEKWGLKQIDINYQTKLR